MASKRPEVTRFTTKKTYAGREVKRARLLRQPRAGMLERAVRKGRAGK